ncbi:MAG: hypothetical protein ABEJ58_01315 [Halodesulfurarchaeum sp.]
MELSQEQRDFLEWVLDKHILGASLLIYVLFAIPMYFWLEGPVGTVGTVDSSVALAGLIFGSMLFVPLIAGWLRSKRIALGFGADAESVS